MWERFSQVASDYMPIVKWLIGLVARPCAERSCMFAAPLWMGWWDNSGLTIYQYPYLQRTIRRGRLTYLALAMAGGDADALRGNVFSVVSWFVVLT